MKSKNLHRWNRLAGAALLALAATLPAPHATGGAALDLDNAAAIYGIALDKDGHYYSGAYGLELWVLSGTAVPASINSVTNVTAYGDLAADGFTLAQTWSGQTMSDGTFELGGVALPMVQPPGSEAVLALAAWTGGAANWAAAVAAGAQGGVIAFANATVNGSLLPPPAPPDLEQGWNAYGQDLVMTPTGSPPNTPPALTWKKPSSIIYGTALSSVQLNATANVPGSKVYSPPAGTVLPAGTHILSLVFSAAGYSSVTANVSLVVLPAPLTVGANNATRLCGAANPAFTDTISGLVNGDNITAANTCSATTASPAGTYPILPALIDPNHCAANYTVSLVNGTLTVLSAGPPSGEAALDMNNADGSYGIALDKKGNYYSGAYGLELWVLNGTKVPPAINSAANVTAYGDLAADGFTLAQTWSGQTLSDGTFELGGVALPMVQPPGSEAVLALAAWTGGAANWAVAVAAGAQGGVIAFANATVNGGLLPPPAPPDLEQGWNAYGQDLVMTPLNSTAPPPPSGEAALDMDNAAAIYGVALDKDGNYYSGAYGLELWVLNGTAVPASLNSATNVTAYGDLAADGFALAQTWSGQTLSDGTFELGETVLPMVQPPGSEAVLALAAWTGEAANWAAAVAAGAQGGVVAFVNQTVNRSLLPPPAPPDLAEGWNAYGQDLVMTPTGSLPNGPPVLTWNNPASIIYGTALSSVQLNATADVPGSKVYSPPAGTVLPAGTNILSLVFSAAGDSSMTTKVSLVVLPAPLTVTAKNASRPYGQTNPVFTDTITGLVNGDNITATTTCSATPTSPPGSYPILPTLVSPNRPQTNYHVTLVDGTLTVLPVIGPPVLAALADRTVYAGSLLSFWASATETDQPPRTLSFSLGPGAPAGASIGHGSGPAPVSGLFTWTPTAAQAPSTNRITVIVSDDGVPPLSASASFTVVVKPAPTPPVLAALADRSVYAGSLLSFRASATETDQPPRTLTFSLGPGAPAGASIGRGTGPSPVSGLFTWTPTAAQAPSTKRITVIVTDNGVPPLSASNSFTVAVLVPKRGFGVAHDPRSLPSATQRGDVAHDPHARILSVSEPNAGQCTIRFSGVNGQAYELQASSDLETWRAVTSGVFPSTEIEVVNAIGARAGCFYRIRLLNPGP